MEQPVVQGVEQAGAVQPEVRTSDYDAIIKGIIAAGGKKLPGIRVKNANFTEKDNYTMVSFTLGKQSSRLCSRRRNWCLQRGYDQCHFYLFVCYLWRSQRG